MKRLAGEIRTQNRYLYPRILSAARSGRGTWPPYEA
jgi:hypothetical protein